jgi:hypothetical protein
MKYSRLAALILAAGILLIFPLSGLESQEQKAVPPPPSDEQKDKLPPKESTTSVSLPVYKPPLRGAPGGRVGGGTRGIRDELFTLFLLAPDHVGLTGQEQPTLYWYLSKLTRYPIEVTIIEDQAIYPLFEKRISLPVQPGIQQVRLADYDVHLLPNIEYWWFVSVVPDPDHRSRDILAGGLIERIEISESLRAKLAQAEKGETPQIYAEAGIWYDALMTISDLIDATPNDTVLRKQRAALLEEVGLSEIAGYETKQDVPVRR